MHDSGSNLTRRGACPHGRLWQGHATVAGNTATANLSMASEPNPGITAAYDAMRKLPEHHTFDAAGIQEISRTEAPGSG